VSTPSQPSSYGLLVGNQTLAEDNQPAAEVALGQEQSTAKTVFRARPSPRVLRLGEALLRQCLARPVVEVSHDWISPSRVR